MRLTARLICLTSVLTLALLAVADEAEARGRKDGARARSGSAHKQVTRTGPRGGQRTWTENRSWKRSQGRFESQRERTGPGGRTRTKDVQAERTETGYRRGTTWTDARGNQATRDATVNVDREAGVRNRDVEWVGRDGHTRTRQDTTTRTESGYTRSSIFTDKDRNQATRDATVDVDREAGTASKTVDWTGPDGSTASRVKDVVKTDSGRMATTTVTRPDGSIVTYEKTIERELEFEE